VWCDLLYEFAGDALAFDHDSAAAGIYAAPRGTPVAAEPTAFSDLRTFTIVTAMSPVDPSVRANERRGTL
jgi:hypothetical protein